MRTFDATETRALLPYPALAEALGEVLGMKASGEAHAPPRLRLPLGGGATLLVMPAADGALAVTKLVTVHPGNAERGLPTIRGEVVAMRAATGERLGVLDGATVTARRTAALSLLAASSLAPRPDGPLLILGAGTQGRAHLEAFREGLGTEKVFVGSRGAEGERALVEHARGLGMEALAVEGELAGAVGEVTLVVTATTSEVPVLSEGVRGDAFVAAVGSFRPHMVELPAPLVAAARVVVDDLEGAREEAGDLISAGEAGAFDWGDAVALEDALRGPERFEERDGPIVFESVGHALWDLAAARLAFAGEL
ncbi:delta(1)-pyrroline-2-carboxylate reductase family protein [Rubrobacter marinus]|uniref:Delta(1)-pyrroline-2-carboxylate reductase family protein n=1 Tax=Rubrobacter marinus TaxID=2653852 RepID=A0A6G8PWN8_9ACTN|nr:delta(1)-pyrroline-2-carboxylate reductase family protein [Rubrobacter marinus]QIN78595.1 delta(1)-pyrroline-2-carboxylate reductase family protein [Rubrobacter marinus]